MKQLLIFGFIILGFGFLAWEIGIENSRANLTVDNKRKIFIKTPSDYKNGIIIGKYIDSINYEKICYRIILKQHNWYHHCGPKWITEEISVTEYEYNYYNEGDTIR